MADSVAVAEAVEEEAATEVVVVTEVIEATEVEEVADLKLLSKTMHLVNQTPDHEEILLMQNQELKQLSNETKAIVLL